MIWDLDFLYWMLNILWSHHRLTHLWRYDDCECMLARTPGLGGRQLNCFLGTAMIRISYTFFMRFRSVLSPCPMILLVVLMKIELYGLVNLVFEKYMQSVISKCVAYLQAQNYLTINFRNADQKWKSLSEASVLLCIRSLITNVVQLDIPYCVRWSKKFTVYVCMETCWWLLY